MGWLWIIAAVLGFFALLFLLPISLRIGFNGEVTLDAGLPGIYFPILPKKPRKYNPKDYSLRKYRKLLEKDRQTEARKKQKALEKAQKKKDSAQSKQLQQGKKLPPEQPSDEPSVVRLILPLVGGILDTFAGKIRVKLLHLDIRVGGSDATQIALTYGAISQGVAFLLTLIAQKTRYVQPRRTQVSVTPDFLLAKTQADVRIIFRLSIADLLSTGIIFLVRFLRRKAEYSSTVSPNPVKKEA